MLKERAKVIKWTVIALDILVVSIAFFIAYFIRAHFHAFYKLDLIPSVEVIAPPVDLRQYLLVLFLWAPLWVITLAFSGIYRSFRILSFLEITWCIVKAAFFSTFAFGGLAFILKIDFVSRVFFILFLVISCTLLILEKLILVSIAHHMRQMGYNFRMLLIVGTGTRAKRFIQMIKEHPSWGLQITGLIDDEKENVGKDFLGIRVIGTLADIPQILRENVIDEVLFVVPRMWLDRIQESITDCEIQGVKASVAADLFDLKIARASHTDLNGIPLMTFETTFGHEWQLFSKRAIDLTVSTIGLIVFSPFLFIIAGLIKLTSKGTIFFRQKRMGVNGRIFTLYKFRTMYTNAEQQLAQIEHLNEMDGPVFKIKNDPRITPLGRFLRTTSIDELPQLFNVFLGHMSIVGPRPPIPDEVNKYEHWQIRRLSMRPGITCLWQINGRNKIRFNKWMELDLKYIDNWSLWLDFKILMKTVPVVLSGVGAS